MKKLFKIIFLLLLAAWMTSCNGGNDQTETEPQTQPETEAQTQPEEETVMETTESTEIIETAETAETQEEIPAVLIDSRFPKAKQAKLLYRISEPSTFSEKLLLGSLQGLAAKHSDEQILITAGAAEKYLPYVKENWNCPVELKVDGNSVTVKTLAEHYKDTVKGYILCSMKEGDESVNVAISLAGVLDAVVATKATYAMLDKAGYECILDVTECDDAWLRASEYWEKLNRDIAFEQPNRMAPKLVDYAVLCGSYFNFYDGRKMNEHKAMYDFLNDNGVVFGYNNTLGEFDTVKSFSEINLQMIPSDHAYNIATLSGFPLESMSQNRVSDASVDKTDVHTVCFLMSDGDNMQWTLNDFTANRWYGSPLRGTFDIGWGIPPTSIDLIAPMATYLYDNMTERDEFIMELSGLGYTFPSKWESEHRKTMAAELAAYMKRSDLRYAEILDDNGFTEKAVSDFTAQDGIDGLFYIEYSHYAARRGKILWTDGKPTVSARYRLWANNQDSSIETLAKNINKASTDVTSEKAYSFIIVHAWSGMKNGKLTDGGSTMEAIAALIAEFDENVEVVTPSEFMDRLIKNCKPE